jgi:putative glutamine amidotransferase
MEDTTPSRTTEYTPDPTWFAPVIGIPCPWSAAQAKRFAPVWHAYSQVIAQAGGIPLWLPKASEVEALAPLWMWLDGVLLPGGADVEPAWYGEAPHPLLGMVDLEADRLEFWLAREALERQTPVLGINRGLHVLNVVQQGTLYQDLGSQVQTPLCHVARGQSRAAPAHPVALASGTRLAALLGPEVAWVNSWHHQAIKDVGAEIDIAAMSPDDLVEAIEVRAQRFAVAIQWPAEALALAGDVRMQRLFAGFVEVARTCGMERRSRFLQARARAARWEQMWERDLAAYTQGRTRLFGEEDLPALEELALRRDLPVLKGRVQAIAEALGLADPTSPAGHL